MDLAESFGREMLFRGQSIEKNSLRQHSRGNTVGSFDGASVAFAPYGLLRMTDFKGMQTLKGLPYRRPQLQEIKPNLPVPNCLDFNSASDFHSASSVAIQIHRANNQS
jgi:hypothetical protein